MQEELDSLKGTRLVKAKNRQSEMLVINKSDFVTLMQKYIKEGLSQEFLELIEPIIQLNIEPPARQTAARHVSGEGKPSAKGAL